MGEVRWSSKVLLCAGASLLLAAYVAGYVWCRQGHYLIHRVAWMGEERFHTITTGDPGNFAGWWYTATHSVPYVVFSPLRWLEAGWWEFREE